MNLKINKPILRDGKRLNEGEKINLPNHIANVWIKKGWASKVSKKTNKSKFETKELKIESKDIKDDATD